MHRFCALLLPAALLTATPGPVTPADHHEPPERSAEETVRHLYDLITFDPGQPPDWNQVRELFLEEAVIVLRTRLDLKRKEDELQAERDRRLAAQRLKASARRLEAARVQLQRVRVDVDDREAGAAETGAHRRGRGVAEVDDRRALDHEGQDDDAIGRRACLPGPGRVRARGGCHDERRARRHRIRAVSAVRGKPGSPANQGH